MHLEFRNVNHAFLGLVDRIHYRYIPTVRSPSRVGDVLMVEEPVIVTYTHPCERVLFNRARDANPFFHLFEALWMLTGRNDVAALLPYNSHILDYSDDGKTFHGAYGYRWRKRFEYDQLELIVRELKEHPESRRCVLSMWNAYFVDADDPRYADDMEMMRTGGKDIPCNTHAYFAIRDGALDMTVCNRSNDMIWGMLGANVVHFSILQEYLAACIGVVVGRYHQITNNLHVYADRWEPERWLTKENHYDYSQLELVPLVEQPARFDEECTAFVNSIDGDFQEPFLRDVAQPMCAAFRAHKRRNYRDDNNALRIMERVQAKDWRMAGTNWITKRQQQWEEASRAKTGVEQT